MTRLLSFESVHMRSARVMLEGCTVSCTVVQQALAELFELSSNRAWAECYFAQGCSRWLDAGRTVSACFPWRAEVCHRICGVCRTLPLLSASRTGLPLQRQAKLPDILSVYGRTNFTFLVWAGRASRRRSAKSVHNGNREPDRFATRCQASTRPARELQLEHDRR